jgi:hypothetical protein
MIDLFEEQFVAWSYFHNATLAATVTTMSKLPQLMNASDGVGDISRGNHESFGQSITELSLPTLWIEDWSSLVSNPHRPGETRNPVPPIRTLPFLKEKERLTRLLAAVRPQSGHSAIVCRSHPRLRILEEKGNGHRRRIDLIVSWVR